MNCFKNFNRAIYIFVACMGLLFSFSSCNNSHTPQDTMDFPEEYSVAKYDTTYTEKDAQFLVSVAEINLEEIKLGQLAQQNGTLKSVKELGKMMEEAHRRTLNSLTALAGNKLIPIPTLPAHHALVAYKKLCHTLGADFDVEYCDMMVNNHRDAIVIFDKASNESTDPDIREWAIAMLPELCARLDQAINSQRTNKESTITASMY